MAKIRKGYRLMVEAGLSWASAAAVTAAWLHHPGMWFEPQVSETMAVHQCVTSLPFILLQLRLTFLIRGARLVRGTLVIFFAGCGVEKPVGVRTVLDSVTFRDATGGP